MSGPYRQAASDLGPLVREHRNDGDGCLFVSVAIAGVLAAVALVATRLWWGLVVEVLGMAAVVGVFRRRGRSGASVIELHDKGLVLRIGQATTAMVFDDVRFITSKYTKSMRSGVRNEWHRIESVDGRHIEFGLAFRLSRDLFAAIEAQTLPRLRTESLRSFDAGKVVRFGPFTVSEEGIGCDGEATLPWAEAVQVTMENGMLEVRKVDVWDKKGKLHAARGLSLVPNARVFVEMCELAVERERDEGAS